jgi:hypothetical protein
MNSPNSKRQMPSTAGQLLIAVVVIIVVVALVLVIRSRRLPRLTRDAFDAAKAKWDAARLDSYELTVRVTGMQPGIYEVSVENGTAKSATFDGRDLTRPRTFGTWSVPGMFDTLARDLETNERHDYLMLGAEFHPDFGIPMSYERIELRTGAHDALQWNVTRFQPNP